MTAVGIFLIFVLLIWIVGVSFYAGFHMGYNHGSYDTYRKLGFCDKNGKYDEAKIERHLRNEVHVASTNPKENETTQKEG